ncbi:hypothetical protein AB0A77_01875 [Streptomyces varsoviensis]|uniref:hypothetical protein n=1 Tax=Streptomyces varsoviensis TaxID=67373 RepID=UPI0033E1363B
MITEADIGHQVEDATGRVGILRDLIPDYVDPADPPSKRRKRPVAFLWPVGGGEEWLVPPDTVKRA